MCEAEDKIDGDATKSRQQQLSHPEVLKGTLF
jgi:hypothetical protein